MKKKVFVLFIAIELFISTILNVYAGAKFDELSLKQKNAITMLNYLVVLSNKIKESKNSKLFLEEAYKSLFQNTNKEALDDEEAYSYLLRLTDTIEKYRMINVKRERLQYIYDQNKAQTLRNAMPNPIGLLSAVSTRDLIKMVSSVVYMAIDAKTSYDYAKAQLDMKFLQDGWSLDDEAAEELHENNKNTMSYQRHVILNKGISDELSLSESDIEAFMSYLNNDNIAQKIQFLESKKKLYSAFSDYWIALIDAYYKTKDYEKVIDAAKNYENLKIGIFKKQRDFSRVIPLIIVALDSVNNHNDYEIERYCDLLLNNTIDDEWDLKYFVAQTYLRLYDKTKNTKYLKSVYDIAKNNVNYLVRIQEDKNKKYLSEIELVAVPKKAKTNSEKQAKKDAEQYNKMLKEERKKELPPIYEPLLQNCDLLFNVAKKLNISDKEKSVIDKILHGNDTKSDIFLVEGLDRLYRFGNKEMTKYDIEFNGKQLIIPACYVTNGSIIKTTICDVGTLTCDDWEMTKVERKKDDNIENIKVYYSSDTVKKHKFVEGSNVKIEIAPYGGIDYNKLEYEFEVSKEGFLPILKSNKFNIK